MGILKLILRRLALGVLTLLAVSLATALLVARTFGLLTNYTFIPNLRPARSTRSNPGACRSSVRLAIGRDVCKKVWWTCPTRSPT